MGDYRPSQGIEVHGMHVSSWRELDLATQLDSLHGLSEESGPSWVQPQHPEHVSHCSIDFMNLENGSDLVASPAPSITYKVMVVIVVILFPAFSFHDEQHSQTV